MSTNFSDFKRILAISTRGQKCIFFDYSHSLQGSLILEILNKFSIQVQIRSKGKIGMTQSVLLKIVLYPKHTWARGGWWGVGPPPLR